MQEKNVGIKIHNVFYVDLIDSITGETKISGKAENTVVPQCYTQLFAYNSSSTNDDLEYCMVTSETNLDDLTKLNNPMNTTGQSFTKTSSEWIDDFTVLQIGEASFPATTAFVGVFSCIGTWFYTVGSSSGRNVSSFSSKGCSKALIKDAEGNVIKINKTDLDIIKITYHIYVSLHSTDTNLKLIPKNTFLNTMKADDALRVLHISYDDHSHMPYLRSNHKYENSNYYTTALTGYTNYVRENNYYMFGLKTHQSTYDTSALHYKGTASRFLRDALKYPHYYNELAIRLTTYTIGYITLPNTQIFPQYTLSPMLVGIGDGETIHFELPLPYFLEGTEVLKVGDKILTRDVDYVIDNFTTYPCYTDVNPWAYGTYENFYKPSSKYSYTAPFFSMQFSTRENVCYRASDGDMLITPDETYGYPTKINYFRMANILRGGAQTNMEGLKFILSYSNDKINWTEVSILQVPLDYTKLPYYNQKYKYTFYLEDSFEPVDALWWRVHWDFSECTYPDTCNGSSIFNNTYLTDNSNIMSDSLYTGDVSWLGYKGSGITLKTPPDTGAEITMTAMLDRPYKTTDYVMDMNYGFDITP